MIVLQVATRLRQLSSKQGAVRTRDNSEVSGFFLPAAVSRKSAHPSSVTSPLTLRPTEPLRTQVRSASLACIFVPTARVPPCPPYPRQVRDGDELFFTMTIAPTLDEGGAVVHSAWQHAAFLRRFAVAGAPLGVRSTSPCTLLVPCAATLQSNAESQRRRPRGALRASQTASSRSLRRAPRPPWGAGPRRRAVESQTRLAVAAALRLPLAGGQADLPHRHRRKEAGCRQGRGR